MKVLNKEKTSMYLVMGITGKVGGRHRPRIC